MQAPRQSRRLVAQEPGKLHHAAVALDQRRQHRTVRVGNPESLGTRSRRQQFVAGDHEPHARPPHHLHLPCPIELRTPTSCGRSTRPASSTVVPATMSSPRRPTCLPGDTGASALMHAARPASPSTHSAGSTASAPRGMGAPGHHAHGLRPAPTVPAKAWPGIESPITVSANGL